MSGKGAAIRAALDEASERARSERGRPIPATAAPAEVAADRLRAQVAATRPASKIVGGDAVLIEGSRWIVFTNERYSGGYGIEMHNGNWRANGWFKPDDLIEVAPWATPR